MTNKELQDQLKQYPDDLPVAFFSTYIDECSYGSVDEVDKIGEGFLGDSEHPTDIKCIELFKAF